MSPEFTTQDPLEQFFIFNQLCTHHIAVVVIIIL